MKTVVRGPLAASVGVCDSRSWGHEFWPHTGSRDYVNQEHFLRDHRIVVKESISDQVTWGPVAE